MAHMFPDCVGEVDVVSDAENIKKLLKIPYSHGAVSMMIHRIENTLLIDEFDIHKFLLREAESQWQWFKKFFIEHVMQSVNIKEKLNYHEGKSRNALQQKSLVSKFLYHSLVIADSSQAKKSEEEPVKADPSVPIPLPYTGSGPPLPEPTLEEELPDASSNHNFARNVVWTFEDIQMLLGTDMPIFGGGTHPCISLRLRDMTKPINVLTGMDYWLDNLMCNVPEVVMCYHLNGIVQKYELIKTEDLPHLENSKFSPKVIRDIAQNILSFLKANATKAGHTYWLFKGTDDDVVKLYDLTSLCTEVMDDKGQTPFTIPVAMLLYRVARNMKNASDGAGQSATIRMLLNNCVSLLPPEKYPEIVTSAHYMLSDLYIPVDINPASPDLGSEEVSNDLNENNEKFNEKNEDLTIKSLSLSNISEISMEEAEYMPPPPPLGSDVVQRCLEGISHVIQGLRSLRFLIEPDEEPVSVCEEEEPAMAKPYQTIPMPYAPLKKSKKKNKKQPEESNKSLLCKIKTDAIPIYRSANPSKPSWNLHLKILLYEKACLIYATLLEKTYSDGKFGTSLHYIRMVLKTRRILKELNLDLSSSNGMESYLLGRAGDAFFMVVQNSKNMEEFDRDYCGLSDFDKEILEEIEKEKVDVEDGDGDVFPRVLDNIENILLSSSKCYQKALSFDTEEMDRDNLQRRLGNIENELGVFYMNQAAVHYQKDVSSEKGDNTEQKAKFKELFSESLKHLETGIKAFETVKDEANLALLHSNTGRLMRLRAHFHSPEESDRKELAGQERHFYGKAVASYQKALQVLGERKYNPVVWDSVNWELSTALYTMATLLQDFPACVKSQEEAEREVTEMLHKALKYCDVETPGHRQPIYQFRSAMIHHRLASLYHKSFRSSADDDGSRRKKILQLCKLHYEKSSKLLLALEHPAEFLRVQLERVALLEFQAESTSSPHNKIKHLENALELLTDGKDILKIVAERENKSEKEDASELDNELNLLILFEQRLQFILLTLTKLCMGRKEPNTGDTYKRLYASILKMNANKKDPTDLAKTLLNAIGEIFKNIKFLNAVS